MVAPRPRLPADGTLYFGGPAALRLRPGPYQPKPGGRRAQLLARWGRVQLPYLEDPNTGAAMFESADIITYLEQHYAREPLP